ncbi:tetratricopeptide repeat protein [Roseibium sp.]|uniref:tetratricopeptide repeat protein n=1 Tax=Roseibium sp. TaxID=1936156 RepID=UPI003B52105F
MAKQAPTAVTREFHGDSSEVLAALNDVLSSSSFANADRLKNFLEYVVQETLKGRAEAIKGKTIAQDVYGRSAATDGDPENVVRVDARRLRRKLADYYNSEGKTAAIRIHIDSGGYAPRFETVDSVEDPPEETQADAATPARKHLSIPTSRLMVVALLGAIFAAVLGSGFLFLSKPVEKQQAASGTGDLSLERQALLEKSPATLQAFNMIEQARQLLFPIFDLERQQLALGFFKKAIQLDPGYYRGYAGAGLTMGTLALLSPGGPQKEELRASATEYAQKAVELNPTSAVSQSSASWVALANGQHEDALRLSKRAHALAPDDLNVLGIYGIIALANGDPQLAFELSKKPIEQEVALQRTAIRNVYAVANYFLGDYHETLEALQIAAERGEPVSSGMLAFRVVAHHALGEMEMAHKHAKVLQENWPVAIDKAFERILRNPEQSADIARRLRASGWSPPASGTTN